MNSVEKIEMSRREIDKRYNAIEEITRVGIGKPHAHPESEYIRVLNGKVIVTYSEKGEIKRIDSKMGLLVRGNVPHQVFVDGSVIVHTTKKNLSNLDLRKSLSAFKKT